jgi:subtilisin family serine protease
MNDTSNGSDGNGNGSGSTLVRLYARMVALPLLERMKEQEEKEDEHEAKARIPVVIDLNLTYRSGVEQARRRVFAILQELHVPDAHVFRAKSELTSQYVFAELEPEEIRALARRSRDIEAQPKDEGPKQSPVFYIWPDFEIEQFITKSAATVKVDAARRSFQSLGKGIVWAVIDSGIDGTHAHFKRHGTLDVESLSPPLRHMDFTQQHHPGNHDDPLQVTKRESRFALTDEYGHGTHVAGIIAGEFVAETEGGDSASSGDGASRRSVARISVRQIDEAGNEGNSFYEEAHISGMAPLAKILSVKVLDDRGKGSVSNILAALAKIQKINEYGRWVKIHGVNLSLGYGFDPEWFAAGQSPLCVEVNRLVRSGVVVVCSAGNSGYGTRDTAMTGLYRSGLLMTINDPGNAEEAITVGSTHRDKPHTFGTSYFSSKGPTGDGRLKPDLLAPGERIISCGAKADPQRRGGEYDGDALYYDQSGTSMAAPHVSGAIAAFLSIRREFIGQPHKVKEIFMRTATDLGRDRYMQGAGLIDLMRALQSV